MNSIPKRGGVLRDWKREIEKEGKMEEAIDK